MNLRTQGERHALFHQFCIEDIIETCVYQNEFQQVVSAIYNRVQEPKQENFVRYVTDEKNKATERFWNILEDTGKQAIYENLNILLNNGKKRKTITLTHISTDSITSLHSSNSITSLHSSTNSLRWQYSSDNLFDTTCNPFECDSDFERELEDLAKDI